MVKHLAFIVPSLLLLAGCAAPVETSSPEPEEDVGTATSALCTDSGAANYSAPVVSNPLGSPDDRYAFSASPSATYGSAACSGRYVVEGTGTTAADGTTWHLAAKAGWADFTLSQTLCPWTEVTMLVYYYKSGAWHQLGDEYSFGGQWNSALNYCDHQATVPINIVGPSKVRVAANAAYLTSSGEVSAKVYGKVEMWDYTLN